MEELEDTGFVWPLPACGLRVRKDRVVINEDEAAGEESSAPGLVLSQDRQREWLSLACTARSQ